jgi:hypothetical protein
MYVLAAETSILRRWRQFEVGRAHRRQRTGGKEARDREDQRQRPKTVRPETERPDSERPETERPESERPETERPETERARGVTVTRFPRPRLARESVNHFWLRGVGHFRFGIRHKVYDFWLRIRHKVCHSWLRLCF